MPRITQRTLRIALLTIVAGLPQVLQGQQPAATAPAAAKTTQQGALAKYVAAEDPSYAWKQRRESRIGATKVTELILTSQHWQGQPWKHQLYLLKPASWNGTTSHALLFITGGSWQAEYEQPATVAENELPKEALILAAVAERMQTPVAVLRQVPNQPLFGDRYEDAIIALTFKRYLETNDDSWPLLLPMAKSAVRAMDATQEFALNNWSSKLKTFTITGASKRGWTTWLTGAVDPRATAIAPMVIDMLNMPRQMKHQKATWGDFSHEIGDYTELNLQDQLDTPGGKRLQQIVDPYTYRNVLVQPKLILLGTNDPYWPLDALNLYWDDLTGPKYILYLPNNRHGLNDYVRMIATLSALHRSVIDQAPLPDLKWGYSAEGTGVNLTISASPAPAKVNIWRASSTTRDFRQAKWSSVEAPRAGDSFSYQLASPASGYEALFGEAVFGEGEQAFYLSTNLRIVGGEGVVEPAE